ncbi:hypothetical protein EMIT0P265_50461 [Pseudomonas zeae]
MSWGFFVSDDLCLIVMPPFASKLAPTGIDDLHKSCVPHLTLWERACSRTGRHRPDKKMPDHRTGHFFILTSAYGYC